LKKLAREDEKGYILILVLILLVVGGLVLTPLLGLMSTGLVSGTIYERKMDEYYAADAGVEDAVWKIQNQVENVTRLNVASNATGDNSGTQIEAYIIGASKYGDYSGLLGQVLTSQGEIDVANKVNLYYPEGGEPAENYMAPWPEPWELEEFYWEHVKDALPYYTSASLDVKNYAEIGPFYRDGTLTIKNTGTAGLTLQLNGTVYITGDTLIGTTDKDFTLDLNGQTIFVSSTSTHSQQALILGDKCTVKGPGAIIVIGDIEFKPKTQMGEEEGGGPVFILSVNGTTTLRPSGDIYGAIAGSVEVEVQQGEDPTITYPTGGFAEEDLNFLIGIQKLFYSIASWKIDPL